MSSRRSFSAAFLCLLATACAGGPPEKFGEPEDAVLEGVVAAKAAAFTPEDDLTPSVSKNGRYLAFASEQNGNLDIWVRDYGTNSTYPITDSSAEDFDPAISPLGDRIAFVSRSDDAKGDLFVTRIATAAKKDKPLTDSTTADRQPMWSPDAKRLYFTASYGIGLESIHAVELDGGEVRRLSPTPGFDPAPSPDGKYLIYTAASGVGGHKYPHLIALRLADSSTRALTRAEAPEGFARFVPGAAVPTLVYVRFADDDTGDGILDGSDLASLWSLSIDLEAAFSGKIDPAQLEPIPLTDGRSNDLFPEPAETSLYFTQGDRQQDVMRLPIGGMFPAYGDPQKYFALAETISDLRTRWFVYRALLARTPQSSLPHAQALLRVGNIHLEASRGDLAKEAFTALAERTSRAASATPEAELGGVARVELLALERVAELSKTGSPLDRERVLRSTESALEELAETYDWTSRVKARVALELAEVIIDRGDRPRAIDALDRVVKDHGDQPFSAARAMLRQIELLGIAHDPDALGEAYARVLKRFPEQREAVRAASERIVRVQLEGLATNAAWRTKVDALSRLIPRYGDSPVRAAARWMLVDILTERSALDDAALQLERLVEEAKEDRLAAAKALERLARVDEDRGRLDRALESWTKLRGAYADVPGAALEAREAITRVGTRKAAAEEARGDKEAARAAYADIIENDLSQVRAHRRWFALSKETGHLEEALELAKNRAERSKLTPMARYAYALGLTWQDPPALDDASEEIAEALRLNPRFTHAYITRGWIYEMRELETRSWFEEVGRTFVRSLNTAFGSFIPLALNESDPLELALDDYTRAQQLNPEAEDPDTEIEVKLNEANAAYRLGDKTSEVSQFQRALSRYVEVLNADFVFPTPRTELVFYERLGRAAAWSEEWALSTMATRRAIALAPKVGQESRLGQLYGTLSLAYDQAGEDAYARAALAKSESALEGARLETKLLLAKRNRAASKLETIGERSPAMLESALEDLRSARALAKEVDLEHEGLPMWVPATDDASSAQYGFGPPAELDVSLALSGLLHRAQGEMSRAEAIAQLRRRATDRIIDEVPKKYGVVAGEPVTLLTYRERFAFAMEAAAQRSSVGERARAEELLTEAEDELLALSKDEARLRDRPAYLADLGRLAASRAEQHALELARDPGTAYRDELEKKLFEALAAIEIGQKPVDTGTVAAVLPPGMDRLASLPAVLSSTAALAETASVAMSPPALTAVAQDARAVRARLHHARGLLLLAAEGARTRSSVASITGAAANAPANEAPVESVSVGDPASKGARLGASATVSRTSTAAAPAAAVLSPAQLKLLLGVLDRERTAAARAREDFERAVREASAAGPALGARMLVLSLTASARLSRLLGDRPPELIAETDALANAVARTIGREDLIVASIVARAIEGTALDVGTATAAIAASMPQELAAILPLATRVLTRSASIAVAANDLPAAFSTIDRAMLLHGAARPGVSLENATEPQDRELGRRARILFDTLAEVRKELAGGSADTNRIATLKSAFAELRAMPMTDGAKARILAEPLLFDFVAESVQENEAMLVPVPIAGMLGLFFVDSSTLAESADQRLHFAFSDVSAVQLASDLAEARAQLVLDRAPPPAVTERIRRALFQPFAAQLAGVRTLFLADTLIGGPVPAIFADLPAPAHVSAPSALAASRTNQLAGVTGRVAIAGATSPALIRVDERAAGVELLSFKPAAPAEDAPGEKKQRALDDRTVAEKLAERARQTLIIEAPLFLEPAALERSAIALQDAPSLAALEKLDDEDLVENTLAAEADRFATELPLETIDVPAETIILGKVMSSAPGLTANRVSPAELVRLDLVLALRGQATVIAVPESVPEDVAKAVLEKTIDDAKSKGPSRALAGAIASVAGAHPSAALIVLAGSPGLDQEQATAFAARELKAAQARALALLKKEQYAAAAVAFPRWIRLMRAAGDTKLLEAAYGALVGVLVDRLTPPQYSRAAFEQTALVEYLASKPTTPEVAKTLAAARVALGRIQGLAGDWDAAEKTLTLAREEMVSIKDALGAARAAYELARHFEANRSDFKRAAAFYEEAIAGYEKERAFQKKTPPEEAMRAVRNSGAIYLNRLSDPARAKAAFERAYRYAQNEEERGAIIVDLARVARRTGDFTVAADHAEQARSTAIKAKRIDLEISAVTEAANVAWYQGDYRRGQDLCAKSLELIDSLKVDKPSAARLKRRRRIYALSVCGLLAMSRREFPTATEHLEHARRLAESISDQAEIATQYNNLGRVFLEFGKVDQAIEAFGRAREIDAALKDRFALAYDLRNLGTALLYKGELEEAKTTLERGLEYAIDAQDTNNELRARFTLGELARTSKDTALARKLYAEALPIAVSLEVKEIAWQIHRAFGLMFKDEGKLEEAEAELWAAVKIVRSITGRAAATDFGPQRYAAFDDLLVLLLEKKKIDDAFAVADLARRLEQTELLDDGRIQFASKDVPRLLRDVREARTASVAEASLATLENLEPHLARILKPSELATLQPRIPEDAAVIVYRVLDDELIIFVADHHGVQARRTAISGKELASRLREYGRRLTARADMYGANNAVAEVLIDPIKDLLASKTRLSVVPHRLIRYVAFAALPLGSGSKEALVDQLAVISALDPHSAVRALVSPVRAMRDESIVALGAPSAASIERPLPFAKKELEMIREEHPRADVQLGDAVTKASLLQAIGSAQGVLHFAGHTRLGGEAPDASFVDPLGGELRTSDGGVTMFDVLSSNMHAELVVLSACSSMLARSTPASETSVSGDEMLSLAQSFAIAGAKNVLATTMHVSDVAAAMMMKRFYREARSQDAASALRSAQLTVRKHFPHAAWWATYALLAGS